MLATPRVPTSNHMDQHTGKGGTAGYDDDNNCPMRAFAGTNGKTTRTRVAMLAASARWAVYFRGDERQDDAGSIAESVIKASARWAVMLAKQLSAAAAFIGYALAIVAPLTTVTPTPTEALEARQTDSSVTCVYTATRIEETTVASSPYIVDTTTLITWT
ncbi:hypothetical protein FISHEDRAFT_60220 [Fistulina hepatica ATCC 64428]|uniref:Uncharacterized protein n=1 Tax=Fistulina hepatica ATCC 64428 TaxID=1128425 RepID=A0A0D7A7B2_9AGAR|nr:hypothetical protein FISHEDRAFT_60220 [Fistulina hepatica ATCC 64428]